MDAVTLGAAAAAAKKQYVPLTRRHSSLLQAPLTAYGSAAGLNPSTTLTTGTAQRSYLAAIAGSDIQFVFWGWYANGGGVQTDLPNAVPLKLSVQINGAWVPVTFGGLVSATLNPGQLLVSDPVGIDVARGDLTTTRTYYNITSGQRLPATQLTDSTSPAGGDGLTTGSDLTTSGTISPNYSRIFCPNQMVGIPAAGALTAAVIGDSIPTGTGEAGNVVYVNNAAQPGFVLRGLYAGGAAGTRTSVGGERADQYLVSRARREVAISGCLNSIVTYSRNDANALIPLATLQATMLSLWTGQARRGRRVFHTTGTPASTSTDGWITTANQAVPTAGAEPIRVGFNNWLRAGAPIDPTTKAAVAVGTAGALLAGQTGHPLYGYYEVADTVESARDSGIWKPAQRVVTDAAITSGTKTLTSATAAFTSADVGRGISVAGAGAAGAILFQTIQSVTNATTVVLNDVAGTTVSGATAGIGTFTADGTHPTPNAHAAMGAAIDTSRFVTA